MTKEKLNELTLKGVHTILHDCAEKEGKVSARTAFAARRLGDPYGTELVREYLDNLATGITNMINIFQPDIICIGGGVSNEKDDIAGELQRIVASGNSARTYTCVIVSSSVATHNILSVVRLRT